MTRSRQGFAFVKRGAAVMLAATLTAGMVPGMALAEISKQGADTVTGALANTGDGYALESGKTYPVGVTWGAGAGFENFAGMIPGMVGGYFGNTVSVSLNGGGGYNVVISFGGDKGYSEAIGDIVYNGQTISQSADKTYTLTVDSLDAVINANIVIGGGMASMFPNGVGTTMALDTSSLPTTPPVVTVDKAALEAAIVDAKAVEQGKKSDDAWKTLQDAIATAEGELAREGATQDDLDAAVTALNAAVGAFGNSEDVGGETAPELQYATANATWYLLHDGVQDEDPASDRVTNYFGKTVEYAKNADGTYMLRVTATGVGGLSFWMSLNNGEKSFGTADGDSYVYTFSVASVTEAINLQFGYTAGSYNGSHDTNLYVEKAAAVDKSALNAAIADAKALAQGGKTDEAWDELQAAIATAEKAAANESIPQQGVDGVTAQLNAAIEKFKNSPDKETPSGDYDMVVGKTYTASVSYAGTGSFAGMQDMLNQMVSKYFGNAVELALLEDGTYDVVVYFGGSTGYDDAIGDLIYNGQAVKQSANKTYTVNVPSLENAIDLALHVGGSMNMDITYAMAIDTSTIALKEGEPPVASIDKSALQSLVDQAAALTQGKKSDAAWESLQTTLSAARAVLNDAGASQDAVNEAATSLKEAIDRFNASENVAFQVGHTYEVPMAFFKHGSVTEKSMAAQYFGDTALVRPQENGTFAVSFAATGQGLEYIKSLSYNGAKVSQNGSQFMLSIPASESDTVIPLDMSITMMEQLGIGQSQVADLHLYLSQAKDLGTGQSGKAASSSNLAQTGDAATGLVTLAGGALVAGAAVAMTARRRMAQRK